MVLKRKIDATQQTQILFNEKNILRMFLKVKQIRNTQNPAEQNLKDSKFELYKHTGKANRIVLVNCSKPTKRYNILKVI